VGPTKLCASALISTPRLARSSLTLCALQLGASLLAAAHERLVTLVVTQNSSALHGLLEAAQETIN
jgi:hypothetical protein